MIGGLPLERWRDPSIGGHGEADSGVAHQRRDGARVNPAGKMVIKVWQSLNRGASPLNLTE